MIESLNRVISFGGSSVHIDCLGNQAAWLIDFLYGNVPPCDGPPPHITLRVRADSAGSEFALCTEGEPERRTRSLADLAFMLLERTTYHLADRSLGGLLLHAAAVRSTNGCVLLPGTTGVGKSLLTAWLTRKGFGYLTDELVYVPLGSHNVHGFARPLCFKASARAVPVVTLIQSEPAARVLEDREMTLIATRLVSKTLGSEAVPLDVVIFPRYKASGFLRVEAISRGRAGLELMACLTNARNLPEHGFQEVTRLARSVRAFMLTYGDFSQLDGWIDDLRDDPKWAGRVRG